MRYVCVACVWRHLRKSFIVAENVQSLFIIYGSAHESLLLLCLLLAFTRPGPIWAIDDEIINSLTLASVSKIFKTPLFFGAPIDGREDRDRNSLDLNNFLSSLKACFSDSDVANCYIGGTTTDIMDVNYTRIVPVIGTQIVADARDPTYTWVTTTPNAAFIRTFNDRIRLLDSWFYKMMLHFSLGRWKDLALSIRTSKGSDVINLWNVHFTGTNLEEITRLAIYCTRLRITDCEDPSTKLDILTRQFEDFQLIPTAKAQYNLQWALGITVSMISENVNWSIFRESGNSIRILSSTSIYDATKLVTSHFQANGKQWKKRQSHASQLRGGGKGGKGSKGGKGKGKSKPGKKGGKGKSGGKGKGGKSQKKNASGVECHNCGRLNHYAITCRFEHGGDERWCDTCSDYGHNTSDHNNYFHSSRVSRQSDRSGAGPSDPGANTNARGGKKRTVTVVPSDQAGKRRRGDPEDESESD